MNDRNQTCMAALVLAIAPSIAFASGQNHSTRRSFGCGEPGIECCSAVAATKTAAAKTVASATSATVSDATLFFDRLVEHYRSLDVYDDTAQLVETTHRDGETSARVETTMACHVAAGELRVNTLAREVRDSLGMAVPVKTTPPMKDSLRKFDLWLAPHMALKFTETPLKEFRAGVDEGFTATEVASVTIDEKDMLHLALRSGDGRSDHCDAKFDLYINRESMLIERIDGEQRLPDGASYCTTLHITPVTADEAASEPAAR